MLTHELQIGDWVHEKYQSQYGNKDEYVQVDGILAKECANQYGGNGTIWGKGHGNLGGGDCLYPIPLTAEILKKNGIKFQFGQPWYQVTKDGLQIVFKTDKADVRLIVSYVHQLQQALGICGLTELANNIKL